jgi:hypothetical protein
MFSGQPLYAPPAALSTRLGQQQGLFALFAHFSHFFAAASPSGGLPLNEPRLRKKYPGFDHLQETKGHARLPVPPAHPCRVQKSG